MSFTVAYVVNEVPVKVTNQTNPHGNADFNIEGSGDIEVNGENTLFDSEGKLAIIEYLEWACSHGGAIVLRVYSGNKRINTLSINGSSTTRTTPQSIVNESSGMWDILSYDVDNNTYKFRLRNTPMYFASGLKITVENISSSNATYQFGIIAKGRVF